MTLHVASLHVSVQGCLCNWRTTACAGRSRHANPTWHTHMDAHSLRGARRYIYTRLAPLTRHLFNPSDDKLLDYLNEEGQSIEPQWCGPRQMLLGMVQGRAERRGGPGARGGWGLSCCSRCGGLISVERLG